MKIAVNELAYLSEVLPSDQSACLEYLNEREIYDRTLRIPYPYTASDFENWLKIVEETTQQQGKAVHLAIRDLNGLLIGGVGFDGFRLGKSHRAEIGYWLAKPFWGLGIATAVVRRASTLAFSDFGLAKLTAHVFPGNAASARVLEKCGFRQEGYFRQHFVKDGKYVDGLAFGLVKDL